MADVPGVKSGSASDGLMFQWMGDISLNGAFCDPRHHAAVRENLAGVADALGACDLRVANWESPLWGDGGVNVLKVPRLHTTREAAECAAALRLDVALLANNHAYDCLEAGFENTVRFFRDHGMMWLGAGRSAEEARRPLVVSRRGVRLGLLNYVAGDTNPNLPPGAGVHLNTLEEERLLTEVRSLAAEVDVVLLHLHWGVDFFAYPTAAQRRLARRAVETGASVVIGHHSHCVHGHERWGTGHIFYGLGNFLFDNILPDRPWPAECRRAAVAWCRMAGRAVDEAGLRRFYQRGLFLEVDETPARQRREERRSRALRLPESSYLRFWRRRRLYHEAVVVPLRFVRDAGGPLRALRRLRWRHVARLAGLVGVRRRAASADEVGASASAADAAAPHPSRS